VRGKLKAHLGAAAATPIRRGKVIRATLEKVIRTPGKIWATPGKICATPEKVIRTPAKIWATPEEAIKW